MTTPAKTQNKYWPRALPPVLPIPQTTLWPNLEVSAARYPDKAAYVFFGKPLSYRELHAQAVALSSQLLARGFRKGDRFCLYLQNTPAFAVIFYAVLRFGGVVVPVNPMCKADELAYFVHDSGSKLVFCAPDLLPTAVQANEANAVHGHRCQLVSCAYASFMAPRADLAEDEKPSPEVYDWLHGDRHSALADWQLTDLLAPTADVAHDAVERDDLALIAYTSGTTGFPKGCMHTHATLMGNAILGYWNNTTAGVTSLASVPMFHITGLLYYVLVNIYIGTTTVVINRWDKRLASSLIHKYRITHWTCIPTMVADIMGDADYQDFGFHLLRYISGGGTGMPKALADRLHAEFDLHFVEGYGLTETVASTHVNPPQRPKHQCLGIPVSGVQSLVVDADTGAALGAHAVGEILISSPTLFKGYWNKPQDYAACFTEIAGQRFFKTGDIGYFDEDGYYFLTDRSKRMINSSGFKVWPSEVESLFYQNDQIKEVCVIGIRDAYRGESAKALVVLKDAASGTTTPQDIQAWARAHMAAYKVPRVIEFVASLPKSGSGKILWRQLQDAANAQDQGA
ncbi:MAG TPA: long-chain-fatty-acid--CoA ligase [Pseudorhodoferax sp.]|jgi:fatty-acyl-CoA synthase|nr:long-chain-fatty-acid--CoA ligase [Pseudorhodoferax sp.]